MIMSRVGCMERPYSQSASAPGSSVHYYTSQDLSGPECIIHFTANANAPYNACIMLISLLHLSRPLRVRMHLANNAPTMHYTQGLNAPYNAPCTSLNQCIAMVDYYVHL